VGTSPDSADAERQFVWGLRYIDDCVLRDRDTNDDGTLDERLFASQDANWNVIAITDDTAAVQERYVYSPYGQTLFLTSTFTTRTESEYGWEILYAAYRNGLATSLFHIRQRQYHPTAGVWIQRDPTGYSDGQHLYHYLSAMPLILTDPIGLGFGLPDEYGFWCGTFHSGGGAPIDFLDTACMRHDLCLATISDYLTPCRRSQCDLALCEAAFQAFNGKCATARCTREALLIMAWMCPAGYGGGVF
jgi:RHS repeat-associated protein